MIMLSGVIPSPEMTGMPLTQAAMSVHIGAAGQYFIAVAIFFFAFTSIIGNYSYAENAMVYLKLNNRIGLLILRVAALGMVVWGALESVSTVFDAADAAMGLMATINLIAICLLSGLVVKLTRDYFNQKRQGTPHFNPADYPELADQIDHKIWNKAPAQPSKPAAREGSQAQEQLLP
jgi:AGCS family alanine or glycine:cation symporter